MLGDARCTVVLHPNPPPIWEEGISQDARVLAGGLDSRDKNLDGFQR